MNETINKPFDKNLKPYSYQKIQNTIEYFERFEEYEKCQSLKEYLIKSKHENDYLK